MKQQNGSAVVGRTSTQSLFSQARNLNASIGLLALLLATGCSNDANRALDADSSSEEQASPRQLEKIGLQLYTLRAELAEDFEGTLRDVAAFGYDEIELDGMHGWDPADVKTLLDELGMDPVASHIRYSTLLQKPDEAIEETLAVGSEYLVLAFLPFGQRNTLDKWRGWVDTMNSVGAKCREAGLQFVYHNHNWEFEEMDGAIPYELILNGIDRDLVKMELDLYWLALGGEQPQTWFERYPGGFVLAHVKDMADTEKREMVDVGDGQLDFGGTFAMAPQSGMKHFFVEHDETTAPMQTIEKSFNYLRQLEF